MSEEELNKLKEKRNDAILAAEKLVYQYFCECDIGPEREYASDVYENVRCATRVGYGH